MYVRPPHVESIELGGRGPAARRYKAMFWLLLGLLLVLALCSWWRPDSALAMSAARAFDSSIYLLGRGDDVPYLPMPRPERLAPRALERYKTPSAPVKRKRITPFIGKKVAAMHKWRCAACGELLTEDFEVDHHISLQNGGSNDIENLRPLHKRCHLLKNSLEQRRL